MEPEKTIECVLCNKRITKTRKVAIAYKLLDGYNICHWTCFTEKISNTHDDTYKGVMMFRKGVPKIMDWISLSDKQRGSAKSLLTKIKIYGDLSVRRVHISGMAASSMMLSPDDVKKIYDQTKKTNETVFQKRKCEWLKEDCRLKKV